MDFDLEAATGATADAIFGGTRPLAVTVERLLAHHGLCAPFWVTAAQNGVAGAGMAAPSPGPTGAGPTIVLTFHPGLFYVCTPSGEPAWVPAAGVLAGEAVLCGSAAAFVVAVQDALLSLRRAELAPRHQRHAIASFAKEAQARRIAVQRLATTTTEDAGGAAVAMWLDIVIHRHQTHLHTIRRKMIEFTADLCRDADHIPGLGHLFKDLVEAVYRTYALSALRQTFVTRLDALLPLVRLQHPGGHREDAVLQPVVARAIAYMQGNFRNPIGAGDVAAACAVTPEHLARLFRKQAGQTVTRYLQHLRVAHARDLLERTEEKVITVAAESGFTSLEHFHRTFRQLTGMTPRQYRVDDAPDVANA